jgi:hypothetical protein
MRLLATPIYTLRDGPVTELLAILLGSNQRPSALLDADVSPITLIDIFAKKSEIANWGYEIFY